MGCPSEAVAAIRPRRTGWTWYSGSTGWMYRLLIEDLLDVRLKRDQLRLDPHLLSLDGHEHFAELNVR